MQTVLIVIHLMVVIALVGVVLLQRSEGGALGIGGASGFLTGRGQANVLTRATAILAALFFATSLGLSILAGLNRAPKSILEGATPPAAPSQPAPGGFDLRKQIEGNQPPAAGGPPAPAAPAAPAPPAAPSAPAAPAAPTAPAPPAAPEAPRSQ
ncbi:MAG: preprotein translocase subunit SecG [Methylobacteriaceae bacterium]|nr:preprotein translocase subunit SecG [Methylobacteriaceae bacterium]MBV9221249.1 preprotein translocase subunit SecG [Methylobacteriaceae bacterium]MBV9244187.1 preprotein translocase subunit SecG [Methylobacteriaceae bacterium]MBV9704268.1 preprotein translocase subunit SecG [Methylobacteriaceae bacterium]